MQQEKQNNQWAADLGSLRELPDGFHFNAQKVWNELEPQIPARAKKRGVVYAAVASVLVIALAAGFFLQQRSAEHAVTVAAPTVIYPAKPVITAGKQPSIVRQTPGRTTTGFARRKKTGTYVLQREAMAVTIPAATKELATGIQPPLPAGPLLLEKRTPPGKNTLPATARTAPRLKIVHLNELGVQLLPEPPGRQEMKQVVQQQQAEQQEAGPAKENLKQILYFKTVPRTSTSTAITNNQ